MQKKSVSATKNAGYECSSCGAYSSSWAGRCNQCGEWNTLEVLTSAADSFDPKRVLEISSVKDSASKDEERIRCNLASLDQIFGGGIVEGSVVLISGEPGMGKSTLLMQLASSVSKSYKALYVSGEESLHQIALRAKRLALEQDNLQIASSISAEDITNEIASANYKLVVIDSIQTIRSEKIGTSAGSVAQVSNCTALLSQAAKQSNTALIIVGHVTKEGNIAGPKHLEHIVDVVLTLEGDSRGGLKLLRSSKNRFGSTSETEIFEMKNNGLLTPVTNPSAILLNERKITDGSVVLAAMEGSRPLLLEVQALVNRSSYGYPKRAVSGLSLSRLNLLIAMLERRSSISLGDKDVYLNVVGGITTREPAADLAVVMALASAAKGVKLKANAVVFGEVGLSGEVRHVPFIAKRVLEAKKLGFELAIGPKAPTIKFLVY